MTNAFFPKQSAPGNHALSQNVDLAFWCGLRSCFSCLEEFVGLFAVGRAIALEASTQRRCTRWFGVRRNWQRTERQSSSRERGHAKDVAPFFGIVRFIARWHRLCDG